MQAHYVTPRLAIVQLASHLDQDKATQMALRRHRQYHHFFNLSSLRMPEGFCTDFKWRGNPFSLTETVRIATQVDSYLRTNTANAALISVSDPLCQQYALFVCQVYLLFVCESVEGEGSHPKMKKMTELAHSLTKGQPYLLRQMTQIYRNISLSSPPVKIIEAFELQPNDLFIPIPEIYTEGRYNELEPVYHHPVEEDLAQYYIQLKRPLETGIGTRHYDSKPQTKYLKKPVIVYGDIKIKVYSYKSMKKQHQFTIGFNTLNIDALNQDGGMVILNDSDLYDRNKERTEKIAVKVTFSDYCFEKKCKRTASCAECQGFIKKMNNRYNQCQSDLERLHRVRSLSEVSVLLSI